MLNDKESPFTLTLTAGGLCLPVLRFSGQEALNQPFRFEIEVMGLAPALAPGRLLHQSAYLRLDDGQGIHGIIHSASCEHRASHRLSYRLLLVPRLQTLDGSPRRRVFVQLSVPQILQRLLAEHHLPTDSYLLKTSLGHYPVRAFCIQYDESDLAFLQRLCEEEGIHYHFEHRIDGHVVVFADDNMHLPQQPLLIAFNSETEAPTPAVNSLFQRHDAVHPHALAGVRNRGRQASEQLAANHPVTDPGAMPAALSPEQRHAERRSRRHLERQRCQYRCVQGRSDCTGLLSGRLLQVTDHPVASFNEQWLVTELRHQGQQSSILDPTPVSHRYHNDFTALPWSTEFRPPLKQPRPNIPGYHLAQVLGVPGHPAKRDDQGRIAVRLWPSHAAGEEDEPLYLPIAMTHAGGCIPQEALPRAGSEVWVSFLDSDPDRPILCLDTRQTRSPRNTRPEQDSSLLLDWLRHHTGP
ncbi:type VI secretion system Vgr family protein [Pseudomonas koreensis]|uniref:Type VI secretion system tip protein VgrG n=1 Tax=Pseudomonas koreensis TaxID=198620 RepID=A0A9X2XIF1_9PSED|nr:type VI secretion system tip protein TssI/VgrG [Pseudomonas koreensis]MCU7249283.1 type VI secretion system tip protein VgrG [Pseudomonas koreensis]